MSPDDVRLLTLARSLAEVAHDGQVRKVTGEPYFTHPERVANAAGKVAGVHGAIVGYLHDVVEDTHFTHWDILRMFGGEIARDVATLTRRPHEKYKQFIGRAIRDGSDTALRVKLADLEDNMSDIPSSMHGIAARYRYAHDAISSELTRRGVLS